MRQPEVWKRSTEGRVVPIGIVAERLTVVNQGQFRIGHVVAVAPSIGEAASVIRARFIRIGGSDPIVRDRGVKTQDVSPGYRKGEKSLDTYTVRAERLKRGDNV